jgi:anaphase-promoting complex subunit 3
VISNDNAAIEREATESLLNDMKGLAIGYHAASRFRTFDAAKAFKALPNNQKDSPWVLSQLAKTYYESGDFRNSEEYFVRLLKAQPSRVEDMEVYSTVLWHLKKESTLSFLCQVLRDQAFDAPQTWVAVGNAFSLAREHDQAISAFRRATQLDDSLAYAWTLMGHEYIANEAYDSAINSFRKSVAVEPLGYAGWYGLGKSYERMQKLEDAERHYRIAMTLNPTNSTLLVCVGVVLERLQNRHAALAHYSKALELTPHSSLARFKKARVLMHLKQYDMALRDLEVLKSQASDEANVWFLLGKCYKGMGNRSGALRALTTALNLDVKVSDRNALKRKPQRKNYDADDGLPRLLLSSKRR